MAFSALALSIPVITGSSIKAVAQDNDTIAQSGIAKEDLEAFIYDYLMDNPGVIIEAVEKLRQNQEVEEAKMVEQKLEQHKSFLHSYHGPSPSVGNPDADIVIVEFFDYNCGYCKKALSDVQTLIESDDNIRVVFKEMPILSPASHTAALWALAANRQGKYWEFHRALMNHSGSKSEKTLEKIAKDVNLDIKQIKEDLKDPALQEQIDKNILVSQDLGIRGTPAFVINDQLSRGYMGIDAMRDLIREIRANKG